jgi:hypothetical protein
MKNAVFWDVAPCRYCINRRFGGMYSLHLQGRRKKKNLRAMNQREQVAAGDGSSLAEFLFLLPPENGGDKFLRNIGLYNIYRAPHPRRRHSSQKFPFVSATLYENIRNVSFIKLLMQIELPCSVAMDTHSAPCSWFFTTEQRICYALRTLQTQRSTIAASSEILAM